MELIDRYVYAVVSKLPEKQRDDIEKEIRSLIEDMKDAYSNEVSEEVCVKKVLIELGNPNKLAENYRDNKRYLIGPENFNRYIFTIKIVLMAVFIGTTVSSVIEGIFISEAGFISIIADYVASLFTGLAWALFWVTIAFAIVEYKGLNIKIPTKEWDLSKLPPVPNKKAMLSKSESIIGIIFITIFTIIFYFFPEIVAIYIQKTNGGYNVIPLFNIDVWEKIKFLIFGLFIIKILAEMIKLISGHRNLKLSIYDSVLTLLSTILLIIIFTTPNIWNANFGTQFNLYTGADINLIVDTNAIKDAVIKIILLITVIHILVVMYKGFKYNGIKKVN